MDAYSPDPTSIVSFFDHGTTTRIGTGVLVDTAVPGYRGRPINAIATARSIVEGRDWLVKKYPGFKRLFEFSIGDVKRERLVWFLTGPSSDIALLAIQHPAQAEVRSVPFGAIASREEFREFPERLESYTNREVHQPSAPYDVHGRDTLSLKRPKTGFTIVRNMLWIRGVSFPSGFGAPVFSEEPCKLIGIVNGPNFNASSKAASATPSWRILELINREDVVRDLSRSRYRETD